MSPATGGGVAKTRGQSRAKSTGQPQQGASGELATPLTAGGYDDIHPDDYTTLEKLQEETLPSLRGAFTEKANAVTKAQQRLAVAQVALTYAERQRDIAYQEQAEALTESERLLNSLAAFHLRVEPLVQSVQGSRETVRARLINGDLPPNLKVAWHAERVPIIPLPTDELSAIVDARNVRAGSYSYGISLVWETLASS